jgi:hypothetical protein
MIPLISTDIVAAGYDDQRQILAIEFTRGRIYSYRDVPEEIFSGLLTSTSPGTFFRVEIMDEFDFRKGFSTSDYLKEIADSAGVGSELTGEVGL